MLANDKELQGQPPIETAIEAVENQKQTTELSQDEIDRIVERRTTSVNAAERITKQLLDDIKQYDLLNLTVEGPDHKRGTTIKKKKYSGLDGMKDAIKDAMESVTASEDKSGAQLDAFREIIDPIQARINRILKETHGIADNLESAERLNESLNDESKQTSLEIPGLEMIKDLEAKAVELETLLDEFRANSYKLVAREMLTEIRETPQGLVNKNFERVKPEALIKLRLAAETDEEKQARTTSNEALSEQGW